ncbi:hypothetical protein NCS57_01058800 [Fusarium keratoplasticum]|uniref:Uncharacterized protein n=1 Tax=Fusarium keratoplasticum TaxID=1328300 RepID=A0ACC0QND6_9HYPO|nr:hypothetical protein NCS57_01058800 [Fusarium keratoplasticum]KAI8660805.1 hypothetical protein NCS57_01058800 [Fusarium keratoplasticum]KAI8661832.1 hypothetical protein NCS55_01054500 [Fusarium keratoplasticum]
MDHTPSHFSPAHASANYQPVPYEETQGHGGEESEQNDLGGPTTSEPDTSENENADPQDGEMPRIERHGLCLATILGDVAAVASPIAFIVFTVMVLCLDGSEASEASFAKWNNATTVLGSLFPIIFASTVGRFVYEVARWKLEQGATLSTLEQLLGSQTVGSTVLIHAKLCAMNPLAAGLLFIWIFSPLGGQSLLRILGSRLEPVVQNSTIAHFDSDAASILARGPIGGQEFGIIDDEIRYLGNWHSALLLAPTTAKTDSMDLWGNVKIPFLSKDMDGSGWSQMSWSPDPEYFSSLAGYPVANVSMGNSTFSMQTSYLQLNCSKWQRTKWQPGYHSPVISQYSAYNITRLEDRFPWENVTYRNGTIYGPPRQADNDITDTMPMTTWNFGVDRFVDSFWLNSSHLLDRLSWGGVELRKFTRPLIFENETGIKSKLANLFFLAVIEPARSSLGPLIVGAECEIKQRYVESRVNCSQTARQNCTVVAQRPSKRRHASEDISHLSFPSILNWASLGLPIAAGRSSSGKADLSMKYLADSKSGHTVQTIYLDAFEGTDMGTQGMMDGMQLFSENVTEPAQVSTLVQIYTISKPWIALCFVSCIVLLCSGVLSVVFAHLADGPEILGYASTAVRDSKFLELLPEVGGMAAIDITRMMRSERLRYGITHLTRKRKRLLGVGHEAETEQIKERFDSGV